MTAWQIAALGILLALLVFPCPDPPLPAWDEELKTKTILVTGATSGIGRALVARMHHHGVFVLAHGRSASKLAALRDELPGIQTVQADLTDFRDVARAADELQNVTIDVLVNNAGYASAWDNDVDVFRVNYLAHVLLTEKLEPRKVVQVSSSAHMAVDGRDLWIQSDGESPLASQPTKGYGLWQGGQDYGNSKLAQIHHAVALRLRKGIPAVSLCPGWVATNVFAKNLYVAHWLAHAGRWAFDAKQFGLASLQYALTHDDDDWIGTSRAFELLPCDWTGWWRVAWTLLAAPAVVLLQKRLPHGLPQRAAPQAYNETTALRLYDWSLRELKDYL